MKQLNKTIHDNFNYVQGVTDVPPTRGTFKGGAETELAISVSVQPTQAPARHEEFPRVARPIKSDVDSQGAERFYQQQQQQQQ